MGVGGGVEMGGVAVGRWGVAFNLQINLFMIMTLSCSFDLIFSLTDDINRVLEQQ